jgi:uncharacterized protein (TIGR03067 family)
MKPLCRSLFFFLAGGLLLGSSAFPSAADEKKATEKTALNKSEKEINRLIDQLGSERFQDREQATQELLNLGKAALPRLKEALKSSDAEVRHRAQRLIDGILAPDMEKELAKLRGIWKLVSFERDGVTATAEELKHWPMVTYKGSDCYWGDDNERGLGGTIVSIDATKNPKTLAYNVNYGAGLYLGIYEIDGDTFKECLTEGSKERPKEFTAKAGSGNQLLIYKRVK